MQMKPKKRTVMLDRTRLFEDMNFSINDGPWIAGGAPLAWFNGEKVGMGDVDIYFKDQKQFDEYVSYLNSKTEYTLMIATNNSLTYKDDKGLNIQLIRKSYYDNYKQVINDFDFTVCQIITDGLRFVLSDQTYKDIKNKTIRINKISKFTHGRVVKYMTYGYNCPEETLQHLYNNEELLSVLFDGDLYA